MEVWDWCLSAERSAEYDNVTASVRRRGPLPGKAPSPPGLGGLEALIERVKLPA